MAQTIRRLALPAACLILMLGLVACGGGDDVGSTSTTGLGSGSAATTSATDTATTGTTDTSATSTATVAGDDVSELFFNTIHKTVVQKGLSEEAAQCIEDKLRASITSEEIDQIKAHQRPESLRAKASEAGTACAAKFSG